MNTCTHATALLDAARRLSETVGRLRFSPPVSHVYNPLEYAWPVHQAYLERYANGRKRIIFVGMNPGPFGMVQTGVPFGEIAVVRDWLGLDGPVGRPSTENPKRPVEGLACARSEVSGRRLWGLFRERFKTPVAFFSEHFVANYCPLAFFDGGRNLTPDKLPAVELQPLLEACDAHLRRMTEILEPEWVIGIGAWAEGRAVSALTGLPLRIGRVLHPSPASPAANRGWSDAASRQLRALGVWTD
jgi:single-strand selective monofunctional uracil DNA glycosylase